MASKRAIRKRKASGQQESENANPQSLPSPSDSKASRYVTIQEFEKLKKKYDALKSARTTEVEKLFQQYKESCEQREAASKEVISKLKHDLESLQAIEKELRNVIAFYKTITVWDVQSVTDTTISCCYAGDDKELHFEMKKPKKGGQWEYVPVHLDKLRSDQRAALPEYLKEEIMFEVTEFPVFVSKMHSHMQKLPQ